MYENVVVEIVEQPAQKYGRFRYPSEGKHADCIVGVKSTLEKRSYPAVRVLNYNGAAVVLVSCVSTNGPHRPHPHSLVGRDGCSRGVCKKEFVTNALEPTVITFKEMAIQCCRRTDTEKLLSEREELRIDPFKTGFKHKKDKYTDIDFNSVRLCFQVLLKPGKSGDGQNAKYVSIKPIVSSPIFDKKSVVELVILEISDTTSPTSGGKKIILFCEKVVRSDIQIRFFRENENNTVEWEAWGKFHSKNVHRQYAISFRTPPYITNDIDHPVKVSIQLVRPSDGYQSDPVEFQYVPNITNISNAMKNKKRKMEESKEFHEYLQGFREQQRQRAKMEINIDPMTAVNQVLPPIHSHQLDLNFPNNGQLQNNTALSYHPQEQQKPPQLYNSVQQFPQINIQQNNVQQFPLINIQQNNIQQFPQNSSLHQSVGYPHFQHPSSSNFSQLPLQQQENINFTQQLQSSHLQQQHSQQKSSHLQQQNPLQSLPPFQQIYSNVGYGLNLSSNYNAVPHCSNAAQMHNSTPQNVNQFCENNMTLINHQESNSDNNLAVNDFENIANVENFENIANVENFENIANAENFENIEGDGFDLLLL